MPVLRSLFGQTTDEIKQSDIVMLLTPHIVRTHELTVDDLAPIYIGTQQNVGLGGPPPLIAPQPVDAPPDGAPAPAAPPTPAETVPGVPRTLASPPPGVPPLNPPPPAGTSPVPTLTPPGAVPPTGAPTVGPAPAGYAAHRCAAWPRCRRQCRRAPPRDPTRRRQPPPGAGAAGDAGAGHHHAAGTEFRVAGGPYTVPVSINNASRVSTLDADGHVQPERAAGPHGAGRDVHAAGGHDDQLHAAHRRRRRAAWTSRSRAAGTRRARPAPGCSPRCCSMPSAPAAR